MCYDASCRILPRSLSTYLPADLLLVTIYIILIPLASYDNQVMKINVTLLVLY